MAERITTLVAQSAAEKPAWLNDIGDGPSRSDAVRKTVTYRTVFAITTPDPIGPEPDRAGQQHHAWIAARTAIHASHHTGPPHEPATHAPHAARILAELTTRPDSTNQNTITDDPTGPTRTGPTRSH